MSKSKLLKSSETNHNDIVLTGMRPTGPLHLGHYLGVIENLIELQDSYKSYLFIADWHAFTNLYDNTKLIHTSRIQYIKGWLAAGVDPGKTIIYNQSSIPSILNLAQIFLSLTPPGWADRSPSWKDLKTNPDRKKDNLGFYTYPILQAADIALVNGKYIPIGEDQLSHLEISREIIRKFNRTYKPILIEPEALLTNIPKLVGIDGNKMSSSQNNFITLNESEKGLQKKINKIKTDDTRASIDDSGNPDNCPLFSYHKIFSDNDTIKLVRAECIGAKLGCGDCKQKLGKIMKEILMPISEKIDRISDDECMDVLNDGNKIVREQTNNNWDRIISEVKFI